MAAGIGLNGGRIPPTRSGAVSMMRAILKRVGLLPGLLAGLLAGLLLPGLLAVLLAVFLIPGLMAPAPALAGDDEPTTTPEQATLVHAGDTAPDFEVAMADGSTFKLADQRGKVVLVNFWTTWCPPCVAEMPQLRDQVLARFPASDFVMVCISREETIEKISKFAKAKKVTELPIASDTDRSIYSQYAEHTIPRNFVVGRDGVVLFQSVGFEGPEFEEMLVAIEGAVTTEAR
ncbi:TlpA family protein disulfide reductase [bacterium]|nr:MAG: TlpA family protein disulfide reductase [bacterium]